MLKIKVIGKHKPSNKILELFKSINLNYTITNEYTQIIEKTNIKYNIFNHYITFLSIHFKYSLFILEISYIANSKHS